MHEHAIRILRFQVDAVLKPAIPQSAPGTTDNHQPIIDNLEVSIAALERDAQQRGEEGTE